jgi:Family of unknown function (DUF5994)
VNGLTGTRRLARPVRLALAQQLGSAIDGAWWPYTASVADELPGLIEALHGRLGEIVDICINWSAVDGPLDLNELVPRASIRNARHRRQRLMVITGRRYCAKLLVVPHMTSQGLGAMVMRCAAGRPVSDSQRETQLFQTADDVMRAAWAESASWTRRMEEVTVTKGVVAQAISDKSPSPQV